MYVKFIYSEKATKFCEIFTLLLSVVKSKVKISQNFVAFSEYMNFINEIKLPNDILGKNLHCINSADSSSTTEVKLPNLSLIRHIIFYDFGNVSITL